MQDSKDSNPNIESKNIWMNLSMGGSRFNERAIILQYLFRKKLIKNIIYSLDDFMDDINETDKYDFLYDKNPFNDIKLYFNPRFIQCALKWSKEYNCVGAKIDIENSSATYWFPSQPEYYGGIERFLKNPHNKKQLENYKNHKNIESKAQDFQKIYENIQKNILFFVKNHPQTQFYFIVPTYSRLFYVVHGKEYFDTWSHNLIYFINQTKNLQNVKIYGFDDTDYPDDIAHYRDTHYDETLNIMQIEAIATQTHILDSNNIESYLAKMQEKIKNYDIDSILQYVK